MEPDTLIPTAIGIVVGVLATAGFGYLFYRKTVPRRRPLYVVAGNRVVSGSDRIEIRFDGEVVPQVTRTLVALWNAGNVSIRSEDVREPLSIGFGDGKVLSVSIPAVTRDELRAEAMTDVDAVTFEFSHLDPNDGAVVEVLHTGRDAFSIDLTGVIVGVPTGPERVRTPLYEDDPVARWIPRVSFAVAAATAVLLLSGESLSRGAIATIGMFVALGLHGTWTLRRQYVDVLPEGLRGIRYPAVPWDEWTRSGAKKKAEADS